MDNSRISTYNIVYATATGETEKQENSVCIWTYNDRKITVEMVIETGEILEKWTFDTEKNPGQQLDAKMHPELYQRVRSCVRNENERTAGIGDEQQNSEIEERLGVSI